MQCPLSNPVYTSGSLCSHYPCNLPLPSLQWSGAGMRTQFLTSYDIPVVGGRAGAGCPGIWELLGSVLFFLYLSSSIMCQAQYFACITLPMLSPERSALLSLSSPFYR